MSCVPLPTSDPKTDKPPRPRRWIQVSLRMFVMMLVVVAVGSTLWIGVPAYRQWRATQEILRVGGKIQYRQIGPEWLRAFVGEERMKPFDTIEYVRFQPDEPTFHRRLSGFYGGRIPYTDGPTIDDSTLACITRVPNLERLDLRWTNVTDAGIKHLAGLRELKELSLDGTDVSDASRHCLAELSNLRELSFPGTKMTDAGLVHLTTLTKLEKLGLDCRQLTSATLQRLTTLQNLRYIYFEDDCDDVRHHKRLRDEIRRLLPGVEIL